MIPYSTAQERACDSGESVNLRKRLTTKVTKVHAENPDRKCPRDNSFPGGSYVCGMCRETDRLFPQLDTSLELFQNTPLIPREYVRRFVQLAS